jgi:hypothetical protein
MQVLQLSKAFIDSIDTFILTKYRINTKSMGKKINTARLNPSQPGRKASSGYKRKI